jgi:type II secretory pathway pseudopilin PulG
MFKQLPSLQCLPQRSPLLLQNTGLTLVETVVSLLVFLAVLTGVVPAYLHYRLQAVQNPVRIGAVAVSQQILEATRQLRAVDTLPSSGSSNTMPGSSSSLTNMSAYGKTYSAEIYYCEKPDFCDEKSRYIRVAVFQKFGDGSLSRTPAYEVSTIFTKLDDE